MLEIKATIGILFKRVDIDICVYHFDISNLDLKLNDRYDMKLILGNDSCFCRMCTCVNSLENNCLLMLVPL